MIHSGRGRRSRKRSRHISRLGQKARGGSAIARQRISVNNNRAIWLSASFSGTLRQQSDRVLSDDGSVSILQREGADARPYALKRMPNFARKTSSGKSSGCRDTRLQKPRPLPGHCSRVGTSSSVAAAAVLTMFVRVAISFQETDDLVTLDQSQNKLNIVRQTDGNAATQAQSASAGGDLTNTTLDTTAAPIAVLALPQKLNGERSLVVLQAQSASPTIVPLAPTATINVDRTDDVGIQAACTAALNDCNLRGAVQFANGAAGTVISIPAGTYTLATNGTAGAVVKATTLRSRINRTPRSQGRSGKTIIRQHGAGGTTGDRVICLNETIAASRAYISPDIDHRWA